LLALVVSQAALAFVGVCVAFSMASPAFLLCYQEAVAPEWRSVLAGFITMSWGFGTAALLFGGGYIAARLGYRALFLTGATMSLLGLTVFVGCFRIPRGRYAEAPH
jgi:predicted MFS family arabinose efflux permease